MSGCLAVEADPERGEVRTFIAGRWRFVDLFVRWSPVRGAPLFADLWRREDAEEFIRGSADLVQAFLKIGLLVAEHGFLSRKTPRADRLQALRAVFGDKRSRLQGILERVSEFRLRKVCFVRESQSGNDR